MNTSSDNKLRTIFVDLCEDIFERQGIYALSASLRKVGVETGYLCGTNHESIIKKIIQLRPHLVMYSAFSHNLDLYRKFDASLKKQFEVVSIVGGSGATFNHSYIDNTTINAACIGEGDIALPNFVANGFGSYNNIYLRGETFGGRMFPLVNLDSLPFPDRNIVYSSDSLRLRLPSKQFVSGRGCPYLCTYCFNHSYNNMVKQYGDIVRKKSVEYLCEEILLVKSSYPLSMVVFSDDTFILNRDWLFNFADLYPTKVGLPYACNIRANLINEDVVRALKESGCVTVNWSIESGDENYRNNILKRNMTDEQILNTAELLNRFDIKHRIGNLSGLPGETLEQAYKTIELNIKAKATFSQTNIFLPYPGLDLTKYAIEYGYCKEVIKEDLPKKLFIHSAMNASSEMNHYLKRLVYLFPLFSKFPKLYSNLFLNRLMLCIPIPILRVVYELFYGFMFRKLYRVKSDFRTTLQLFWQHIRYITG